MPGVDETPLPGVGTKRDFVTERGKRVGVIAHIGGGRSLLLYDSDDPDACRDTVELSEDERRLLADLLRGEQ